MPGFLYFIPENETNSSGVINERKGEVNLDKLHGDLHPIFVDARRYPEEVGRWRGHGPDGKMGSILYPRSVNDDEVPSKMFFNDSHTWVPIRSGKYYIGWYTDHPPTPADLQRIPNAAGYRFEDCVGNEWVVPIIRSNNDVYTLPMTYAFDEHCQMAKVRLPEHEYLWDLAGRIADHLATTKMMSDEDVAQAVIQILGVYYRIAPCAVFAYARMGNNILDTTFVAKVTAGCTDFMLVEEYQKKRAMQLPPQAQDSSSVSPGSMEDTPDTDPAAAI